MHSSPLRNHRGIALVAVMGLLLVLLPLGAVAVWQSRLQQLMARNARSDIEGLYAAEAVLTSAVAVVPPGVGVERILAGPDRVAGTLDDGVFPFTMHPGAAAAPIPPAVSVSPAAAGMVRIRVTVTTPGGRQTRVEALVARATGPFTPATVHVEGDWWGERTPGDLRIDGSDHRLDDPPDAPTGPEPPRPAITATGPTDHGGGGGHPGAGAVAAPALPIDLAAVVQDFLRDPAAVWPAVPIEAALTCGTRDAPQLTVLRGAVDLSEPVDGAGVLVVDGTLHVRGALAFAGLVIARDGIRIDPAATLHVAGALWTGATTGVELRGVGRIDYSSEALTRADGAVAGRLPRAPVVVGWREVL